MSQDILNVIEGKLENLRKMYNAIRLVDPVQKRVIGYSRAALNETQELCCGFWQKGQICDNCISIRAYQESRCYMKLEQNQDHVYLVEAVPVENMQRPLILEMLKDVTETMLIANLGGEEEENLSRYIKKINDMVAKDHLTQLYNRRYVDERLPADVACAILTDRPLALCFIDMDNLTRLNNKYGHEAGDQALRQVGDLLKKQLRQNRDWAARYGGDEFLVCLNDTDRQTAALIGAGMRQAVAETPLNFAGAEIPISVTYGVSVLGEPILTAEDLINSADKHMYAEKRKRRLSKTR